MKVTRNELRLGNLLDFEGEVCIVREIDSSGAVVLFNNNEEDWIDLFQFSGIPLTEEWLLKFGYIHNKKWNIYHLAKYNIDNISHQKDSRLVFRIYDDKINCSQFYLDSMSSPQWQPRLIFIHEIGYAHQLQNIIFALSGEELTLTKGNDPL